MTTPADQKCLDIYEKLPDLLQLAWQQITSPGSNVPPAAHQDVYAIQDALREQQRREKKPFLWSMPYRSLEYCDLCSHSSTLVMHELENPGVANTTSALHHASLSEMLLHKIRQHDQPFPPAVREFLLHLV